MLLPFVGDNAQNSRLCFSDLYTSVMSGSFEGVFLLSSDIAAAVKCLLKCLHQGLYCQKLCYSRGKKSKPLFS